MFRTVAVAAALLMTPASALAETALQRVESEKATFKVVRLLADLEHPWAMAWTPSGEALIATRPGDLYRWRPDGGAPTRISGMPSVAEYGQGGLFDVRPAPDFASTGRVVMSYAAAGDGGAATRVSEARLIDDRIVGLRVLFDARPRGRSSRHYGGRLRFTSDGVLYATFGDRGDRDRAQDMNDPAGSVYAFPPGAKPRMFTSGHRNPQGMAIHPVTGAIWTHEHGPRGGDEVNLLKEGANYGWPIYTYGEEYSGGRIADAGTGPGYAAPLHVWVPSIAPSGMAFYEGDAFPGWRGSLLVGALKSRLLARLTVEGEKITAEERLLQGDIGRIREVSVGPDGLVYLLTDAGDGGVYRLEPL